MSCLLDCVSPSRSENWAISEETPGLALPVASTASSSCRLGKRSAKLASRFDRSWAVADDAAVATSKKAAVTLIVFMSAKQDG